MEQIFRRFARLSSVMAVIFMVVILVNRWRLLPRFVNYPAPDLQVDYTPFTTIDECKPLGGSSFLCEPGSDMHRLCDSLRVPDAMLGGLEPAYPLAVCMVNMNTAQTQLTATQRSDETMYSYGGIIRTGIRYVILRDDEIVLIDSPEKFRETFAPIESPEEALSFALAHDEFQAIFNMSNDLNLVYDRQHIEDSHVEEVDGGYQMVLYRGNTAGCGLHYTYRVELIVSYDGEITEIDSQPIFRNPAYDGMCID